MAKNKKPTKKYKPQLRVQGSLPITYRFSKSNELTLQLLPHAALSKFKEGRAGSEDWHALAARLNLGNTLAYTHYEGEVKEMMDRAALALRSVFQRHAEIGKWGCTGDEFNAMGDGLNLTDQMQKECTRRQLHDAMAHVIRNAAINRDKVPVEVIIADLGI
jgi:hypothetical protein